MLKEFLKKIARNILHDELVAKMSELVDENMNLSEEIENLREDIGDPKHVVEKLLRRGITFFDNNSLPYSEKKQYYIDAQAVLRNKTLMNEINHLVADTVEHIAKHAQDFKEVENLRMQINFAELLQQRLKEIEDPEKAIRPENPDKVQEAYENLI